MNRRRLVRIIAALPVLGGFWRSALAPAEAAGFGPDALGTSRVMPVGTEGGLQIGLKSYPRTLPLADH